MIRKFRENQTVFFPIQYLILVNLTNTLGRPLSKSPYRYTLLIFLAFLFHIYVLYYEELLLKGKCSL